MDTADKLEIGKSRKKLILLLAGAIFMSALSICLLFISDKYPAVPPLLIIILGIIGILFFGYCFFGILKAATNKGPGLILDKRGITDRSNGVGLGLIEWGDITGVEPMLIMSNRFLLVHLADPQKYINRASGPVIRRAVKGNMKMTGTPVAISPSALACTFEQLHNSVEEYLEKYGGKRP